MKIEIPPTLAELLDPDVDPEGHLPGYEDTADTLEPKMARAVFGTVRSRSEVPPALRAEYDRWKERTRKQRARARDRRAKGYDEPETTVEINPRRLRGAMVVLTPLHHLLVVMTMARYNKVRRVLGDTSAQDIASMAFMGAAEGIARQDTHDLVMLLADAKHLAQMPGIPDLDDSDPDGARYLIRLLARQVRIKMADHYRSNAVYGVEYDEDEHGNRTARRVDRTLESLEYLDTVLANSGGVDTLIERSRANRKPIHSSKEPGLVDKRAFAQLVIEAAISERGLDFITEFIDSGIRTDGRFAWTANYEAIWAAIRERDPQVPALPENWADKGKADATRRFVRGLFEFLPGVVSAAYGLVSDPVALNEITQGRHLTVRSLGIAECQGEYDDASRPSPAPFVPKLDEVLSDLYGGKGFVLEGADDENPTMTRLYDPPDASEWSKVIKVVPSEFACKHGQRARVIGAKKKPHKKARTWSGDFCPLDKGAPDACAPVFNGQEAKKVQHLVNVEQRMLPANALAAIAALEEVIA